MSDDLAEAVTEALGCRIVDSAIGRQFWCKQHSAWSDDGTCPEAERITAALAPLIEARVREAREPRGREETRTMCRTCGRNVCYAKCRKPDLVRSRRYVTEWEDIT